VLALFIVTRNEGELLRLNLDHHLRSGFDHVLIADNESTDCTQDVIASFGGAVTSMRVARPNDRYEALGLLARSIEAGLGRDSWIAFSDTDEFWWAPKPSLRALLDRVSPEIALVNSPAKHYVPTEIDAATGPVYTRMRHRATEPDAPPYAGYTNGKSLYRAAWVLEHRVTDAHWCPEVPHPRRRQTSAPIVHHYPIDGAEDFVKTVTSLDRWGMVLEPTASGQPQAANDRLGETKKLWWRIYREGGEAALREYYRSTYVVPSSGLPARIDAGRIVRDDAFADWCALRSARAPIALHGT